jgi:hypothetical protein
MTKKEFLKELKDYFNDYEWRPYDEKRIMLLLTKFEQETKPVTIVKEVIVREHVTVEPTTKTDIESVAKEICEKHKITMEQLKADSPKSCYSKGESRKSEYIEARRDFCITLWQRHPTAKLSVVKRFLGYKCHSSIIHFLNKKNHGRKN